MPQESRDEYRGQGGEPMSRLRVGVIGTSWWVDAMYLPALRQQPEVAIVGLCGRDRQRAQSLADRWEIPGVFTDAATFLDSGLVDGVVIVTPNDTHHLIAGTALERGMHVLCEKPLGLNYQEAFELASIAEAKGVTTLTPFTYRFMPTVRFVKRLIEQGYLGRPHHLNFRYFSGFALSGEYAWRFDIARAGSGVLGDLGSHFIHLAEWFFGDVESTTCELGRMVDRPHPKGVIYDQADDTAVVILQFVGGAQGVIHASAVAHEATTFGQIQEMDLHGSGGSLHHRIDWDHLQQVRGSRLGAQATEDLIVPDDLWNGAPRDPVKATYHHVFRNQGQMIGDWARAAAEGRRAYPDFGDAARVQRVLDAALISFRAGRRVAMTEVQPTL